MYDLMMRLPFLTWVALAAFAQSMSLVQYLETRQVNSVYMVHLGMHLSTLSFLLLLAVAVLLRNPPTAKARGIEPRISAMFGTFLIYAIVLFPRREISITTELVSLLFVIIGTLGALVALSQLGRSFSVMAESRRLVRSGPYRLVRHPLYAAEEFAMIGLFIQFASVWTLLLLFAQISFQLRRVHNEELVLTASFPEYDGYRRSTACLIPGIY